MLLFNTTQFIYTQRFPLFDVPTASVPLQGIAGIAPGLNSYLTSFQGRAKRQHLTTFSSGGKFMEYITFWFFGFFSPEASP